MSSLKNLYQYFQDFEGIREELREALDSWDTPTIVAFGSQNAGKSTLLERLAMIPLFPKGEGLCTRLPIRIRMRSDINEKTIIRIIQVDDSSKTLKETVLSTDHIETTQDISQVVNQQMHILLQALKPKKQGIRSDRLIEVELRRAQLPNLDLLDIPGMVINPGINDDPELPKKTYDLVINTLNVLKGRAIFLAVREAGDDPQQSIVVKVLNEIPEIKEHCFGVLTKCDLMKDQLIADRLQKSKDWRLGYGYFAVVNHPDYKTLNDMATYEKEYFSENQIRRDWLSNQQAGCETILNKLSEGYYQYLKETWAHDTIEHLKKKIQSLEIQINHFGPIFSNQESNQERLAFQEAINSCLNIVRQKSLAFVLPLCFQTINQQSNAIKTIFLNHQFQPALLFGSSLFTIDQSEFFQLMTQKDDPIDQIKILIKESIQSLFLTYTQKIKTLLEDDHINQNIISSLRIGRFKHLVQLILSNLPLQEATQNTLRYCHQEIDQWFVDQVSYENQNVNIKAFVTLLEKLVNRIILGLRSIDWGFDWSSILSHEPQLWEDSSSFQRQSLKDYLSRILTTKNKMFDLFGNLNKSNTIFENAIGHIEAHKIKNLKKHDVKNMSFNMILCPSGSFQMGEGKALHEINMNQKFWIGETLVTQELWKTVMGWNTSHLTNDPQLPVEFITWYDCLVFCNQLSILENMNPCFVFSRIKKEGDHIIEADVEWYRSANGYRLPTEAEWEYSAKANTAFVYSGSDDMNEVAWHGWNSNSQSHCVKQKNPNAWHIYDMSGNVWEWCMDIWDVNTYQNRNKIVENPIYWSNHHNKRVVRGGCYVNNPEICRVNNRDWSMAESYSQYRGLRLARYEHDKYFQEF